MDDQERDEAIYERGRRSVWVSLLQRCVSELGIEDTHAKASAWLVEREQLVAALRQACDELGDNDWPDDLNLVDVLEKHLLRHIDG